MVLIRDPESVSLAEAVRLPYRMPLSRILREYIRFYRTLLPLADNFEVVTFETATTNLADGINRLNRRFGTRFRPYLNNPEDDESCFEKIRLQVSKKRPRGFPGDDPTPSERRKRRLEPLMSELEDVRERELKLAIEIYQRFVELEEASKQRLGEETQTSA